MGRTEALFLLCHLSTTLAMTGLIWFVQVVHYPLLQEIPPDAFPRYEGLHTTRTGWVVAPLMLAELGSGLALLALENGHAAGPGEIAMSPYLWNAAALIGIWLVTFLVQVPHHQSLVRGHDAVLIQSLVQGNWVRTWLWSIRSMMFLWIVWNRVLALRIDANANGI